MKPDGTVIARYGSRDSRDRMTLNSMDGFKLTMSRVLDAYQKWPEDKDLYQQKRGPDYEFQQPEDIPSETIKKLVARNDSERGCIHCHNIYDAKREVDISRGVYDPWKRWKYPLPDRIGLGVDPMSGTTITKVLPGSAAARAGVQAGEEIEVIDGQAIHSLADVQFALHHLADEGVVEITTRRGDAGQKARSLELAKGWRVGEIGWRASMYEMPPRLGLWVQAATGEEKDQLQIPPERLALNIKGVFGQEVRKAGFKKGDVIIEFNGHTDHHTEGQFQAYVRLNHYRPNAVLPIKVLRAGEANELRVLFPNQFN